MSVDASTFAAQRPSGRTRFGALDDVDRDILRELERDGRISNKDLADLVGVAPSTCHARVRALRESGVIRGFSADVDPRALGRGLQAIIAVRLQAQARARLGRFARDLAGRPEVRDVYLLGGTDDVLAHVQVADSDALRQFVIDHLSTRQEVAHTQTSIVFEHVHQPASVPAP